MIAGVFSYRSQFGRTTLAPGAVLLGNAGTCYECGHEHSEGDRCVSFHFDPHLMDEISRAVGARPGFDRPSIPPLRCLSRLYARTMSALNADPAYSEPLAFEVAAAALQLTAASAQAQTRCSPRDSRRMVETARHLERHYAEPLTLSELASNVNLTRAHFLRMFKVTIGTTPHQFVLRLRLRAAARLLLDATNTVTSVAHAAGFQDLSNFTRSFVAEFGCPPSHYRHAYSHRGCRNNV